jgi:hypothetical protein
MTRLDSVLADLGEELAQIKVQRDLSVLQSLGLVGYCNLPAKGNARSRAGRSGQGAIEEVANHATSPLQ